MEKSSIRHYEICSPLRNSIWLWLSDSRERHLEIQIQREVKPEWWHPTCSAPHPCVTYVNQSKDRVFLLSTTAGCIAPLLFPRCFPCHVIVLHAVIHPEMRDLGRELVLWVAPAAQSCFVSFLPTPQLSISFFDYYKLQRGSSTMQGYAQTKTLL